MGIFDIFNRRNKTTKHLLRIYGNLGQSEYSSDEKMHISECFIATAKELLSTSDLKYNILGSGYGLSKGSPSFGEKAYRNKIAKKGFEAMWGMWVESRQLKYESNFILMTGQGSLSRFEGDFSWALETDPKGDLAIEILHRISKVCAIDYAYSYPASNHIILGEVHVKSGFLVSTAYKPKTEELWDENIGAISVGGIKELYPINFFNPAQLQYLENLIPQERIVVDGGAEIWRISTDEIARKNDSLANVLLKRKTTFFSNTR